jgi:UDP-glucuronate 4-epimerase
MNILVTGASGLVGMALREHLWGGPDKVIAVDATRHERDDAGLIVARLEDRSAMEKLIKQEAISHVIHCGAISGPMMARDNPMAIVESNILGTAVLLDSARRSTVKRFVFCSSISVYGDVGPGVITEDTPLRPTSIYGASKVAGEQLVRGFTAENDFKGVSLRLARIYGPYRRGDCYLGTMIRDARAHRPTLIPCDPDFLYHYIYVDDVVDAIMLAATATELPYLEYNVGPAEVLTMPEVVERAKRAIPEISVSFVPGADEISDRQERFDISRIAADLRWKPHRDLVSGIADCARRMPKTLKH